MVRYTQILLTQHVICLIFFPCKVKDWVTAGRFGFDKAHHTHTHCINNGQWREVVTDCVMNIRHCTKQKKHFRFNLDDGVVCEWKKNKLHEETGVSKIACRVLFTTPSTTQQWSLLIAHDHDDVCKPIFSNCLSYTSFRDSWSCTHRERFD